MTFGKTVHHVQDHTQGVNLHFTEGTAVQADIVVGAHSGSSARHGQLLPNRAPIGTNSEAISGESTLTLAGPPRWTAAAPWLSATLSKSSC